MTLGKKLKEIRKKFGLSQENLAEIMNVSRQTITKWESDNGLPDVSNLQELSKVFGITVDYLLNNENQLPALSMRKELNKEKYKNKLTMYNEVLKEYYPEPYEVYFLTRDKKLTVPESLLSLFVSVCTLSTAGIPIDSNDIDALSDLSPYYLVKKDNLKLLVNIKKYVLEVIELPSDTNDKKFVYGKNVFRNSGKINIK
jgi:transcriptional regulator with XRE-family HTH domain